MLLIEALAHKSETPITVINKTSGQKGRQFRWCNGHIQTKTPKGKYWHRLINFPTSWLEWLEISDDEIV